MATNNRCYWIYMIAVAVQLAFLGRTCVAQSTISSTKLLLPIETMLFVENTDTGEFAAIMIFPDSLLLGKAAIVNSWLFPSKERFDVYRKSGRMLGNQIRAELPGEAKQTVSKIGFGNIVSVAGAELRWYPNTPRSCSLERVKSQNCKFGMWRVQDPPLAGLELLSFVEVADKFNDESAELGAAYLPLGDLLPR